MQKNSGHSAMLVVVVVVVVVAAVFLSRSSQKANDAGFIISLYICCRCCDLMERAAVAVVSFGERIDCDNEIDGGSEMMMLSPTSTPLSLSLSLRATWLISSHLSSRTDDDLVCSMHCDSLWQALNDVFSPCFVLSCLVLSCYLYYKSLSTKLIKPAQILDTLASLFAGCGLCI